MFGFWTKYCPHPDPRGPIQEYPQSFSSTGHEDGQLLTGRVAADEKQGFRDRSHAGPQYNFFPTDARYKEAGLETVAFNQQANSGQEDSEWAFFPDARPVKEIEDSKRLEATLLEMQQMLQEKESEISHLSAITQRQNDEIKQTKAELLRVKTRHQQTSQLLHERSEELSTAQQFLGKADSISPTEVVRLIEVLNAEIAHHSNLILDSLTYRKWDGSENDLKHLFERLQKLLGPSLCDNLRRRLNDPEMEFDHLVTQLALQTGLTNACTTIINSWHPLFNRVYDAMRKEVGQVVAGKWRALSSTYLGADRKAAKQYLRDITRKLIIAVSGQHQSEDSLPPDLWDNVDGITRKALEIQGHILCSLTSMDLEAYSVPCGTRFDSSLMEDSEDLDRVRGKAEDDKRRGKVICTLEMGLLYRKGVSSENQSEFREETGVILKSKVVLADALAVQNMKLVR